MLFSNSSEHVVAFLCYNNSMLLTQIEYFKTIIETQSFSKAAELCNIMQSAISTNGETSVWNDYIDIAPGTLYEKGVGIL